MQSKSLSDSAGAKHGRHEIKLFFFHLRKGGPVHLGHDGDREEPIAIRTPYSPGALEVMRSQSPKEIPKLP